MNNGKSTTLSKLLEEIGGYLYDNGDYNVICNTNKADEVAKFVESYLPGAKIIKDGLNGAPLTIQGDTKLTTGVTGNEPICCHGYQLYDLTGTTGQWLIATFPDKSVLEKHILSSGGYLNVYCSDMLVLEDGEIKPFEIIFSGDNETDVVIDKDILDENFDIEGMLSKISINWK